jgi:excisionase family DNA binding protein
MDMLTTNQASELIGIMPNSVRVAILRGKLQAVKHGRDWLIRKEDAEAYAAGKRETKESP